MITDGHDGDGRELLPVADAIEAMSNIADHLIKAVLDGGLDCYDAMGLVKFLQAFERVRNKLPIIDHCAILNAQARSVPEQLCQTSMTRVLTSALRISAGEAARRVAAAEALGERVSMLGERLPPIRPTLAAAQREGAVTPDQAQLIVKALADVDRVGFDPAEIAAGEEILTADAALFGPKELTVLAQRVVDGINPDGTLPKDQLNADRRHFTMRPTSDGAYRGEFRFTGALGAKLAAVVGPLARPRVERLPASGADPGSQQTFTSVLQSDDRTHGQRMHDALEEVCDRVLRAGTTPDSGGIPATVIVTMTLDDLLKRCGQGGVTSDGTRMSTEQILDLADQAEIIPTVLNKTGAVLKLGRSRRVANRSQTLAMIARDRGCSFPGCGHSAEWCERHHIVGWIDGGLTDVDNMTLLCTYHHHNFAGRGWTCVMNHGLPTWIPPAWIDPRRRPMINNRIRIAHRK